MFVVDGIIYDNSTQVVGNSGTDGMTRSNTTYSNRVMDINPEDIETMSILKGAAAAALYGSRAADGAIIITTKKGAEGSVKVDFSSKLSSSWATKLPEVQTEFGRGYYSNNGVLDDLTYLSWGERPNYMITLVTSSKMVLFGIIMLAFPVELKIVHSFCLHLIMIKRVLFPKQAIIKQQSVLMVNRNMVV